MRVLATLMLLAFAAVNSGVFAQSFSNSEGETPKATVQEKENAKQKTAKQVDANRLKPTKQPYHNYKGIKDPVKAKNAWVEDNGGTPEKSLPYKGYTREINGKVQTFSTHEEQKKAWVEDHPEEYQKLLNQEK